MHRREFLGSAGAVGLLGSLAGCASDTGNRQAAYHGPPTRPPQSESRSDDPLDVDSFDYHESESGNLVVTATVENTTDGRQQGTLSVTVEAGGETATKERDVSLAGGASQAFEIPFDVSVDTYHEGGSLDLSLVSQ